MSSACWKPRPRPVVPEGEGPRFLIRRAGRREVRAFAYTRPWGWRLARQMARLRGVVVEVVDREAPGHGVVARVRPPVRRRERSEWGSCPTHGPYRRGWRFGGSAARDGRCMRCAAESARAPRRASA